MKLTIMSSSKFVPVLAYMVKKDWPYIEIKRKILSNSYIVNNNERSSSVGYKFTCGCGINFITNYELLLSNHE